MKSILVIGSLNMDASVCVERFPVAGETILGKSVSFVPGGKGANQAVAAGRLAKDSKVAMVGCVGDDSFGSILIEGLKRSNVDASGIRVCENCSSGFAVVSVDQEGSNEIIVIPGSNGQCDEAYIRRMDDAIVAADYVVFQLEIPLEAVYYGIRRAKALGKTVILNPAPAPDSILEDILPMVDYLTPNETELMHLSGHVGSILEDFTAAAEAFIKAGVANVVVTLGSQGALVVNQTVSQVVPGHRVNAVDTVAAGDCFNAAMVVALSEGKELLEAVSFANKAASVSVSRKGAQDSLPWRQDLLVRN